MTKRRTTRPNETAAEANTRLLTEALRRVRLIEAALLDKQHQSKIGAGAHVHWGHVGDVSSINEYLATAAHYAGVTEFVEQ